MGDMAVKVLNSVVANFTGASESPFERKGLKLPSLKLKPTLFAEVEVNPLPYNNESVS